MPPSDAGAIERLDARRFLVFEIERRHYALPAELVAEIVRVPPLSRVPQAPKALLGVANIRGAVLPLVSVRALLGLEEGAQDSGARAIVLDCGSPAAIAVDAIETLLTVGSESIAQRGAGADDGLDQYFDGFFPLGERRDPARIINIEALMASAFARREARAPAIAAREIVAHAPAVDDSRDYELLVTFDISGQEFALPLNVVREIIVLPGGSIAAPRSDVATIGIVAFRDQLLPLLSLRALLGLPVAAALDNRAKVVVITVAKALVGLVVDRAHALISADASHIEPAPALLTARMGGEARVGSIYRGHQGRRLISILAPDKLFREDIMRSLRAVEHEVAESPRGNASESERRFLVFRLGEDQYGLPIENVDEVARVPHQLTRIPKAPEFLEGVISLRGAVLPVVDQRRRFDMPKLASHAGRRLIVVRTDRHQAGLIVDAVSDVIVVLSSAIEAVPDLTENIARLIAGVVARGEDGRLLLLLRPEELLTRVEQDMLDTFEQNERSQS